MQQVHTSKDPGETSFIIRDKYYPKLVQMLPHTERILFNYIGKYQDKNTNILNSPYPDEQLFFFGDKEDGNILFKVTGINRSEMDDDILLIPKPPSYEDDDYAKKKNSLNSLNVIFILLIRYYLTQKNTVKTTSIVLYYAYSLYAWKWYDSFKPHGPNKGMIQYMVNNMTGKFGIKQFGSINKWISHLLFVSIDTYQERFQRLSDRDIDRLISALITRIGSAVKNVREAYQKVYDEKKTILESDLFIAGSDGMVVDQDTITSQVEKLALEYTQDFFSVRPNPKRCIIAGKASNVSKNELQSTLDRVFDDAKVDEMKEFFRCIFTVYYKTSDYNDIRDVKVKSPKFAQMMESIFRKGNSKDPNILRAKDIIDEWLRRGSKTFRKTTRSGTLIDFRRGVYMYFVLFISGIA